MTQPTLKQWLARGKKEPKVRTRIKRRSTKRAKEERVYNTRVKVWLTLPENHWCGVWLAKVNARFAGFSRSFEQASGWFEAKDGPNRIGMQCPRATTCHHKNKRTGWRLLDESQWLAASWPEHDWIKGHEKEARELGVLQ